MRKIDKPQASISTLKLLGFTAAFAFTLVAFEWKQFEPEMDIYHSVDIISIDFEAVPVMPKPKKKKKMTGKVVKKTKGAKMVIIPDIETKSPDYQSSLIDTVVYDGDDPDDGFEPPIDRPYIVTDVRAEFPGGDQALFNLLAKEIVYPDIALQNGIEGKVHVRFVVGRDGSTSSIEIIRGIGGGCEEEAVRVLSNLPQWKPGLVDGKKVDSYFYLPVNFKTK